MAARRGGDRARALRDLLAALPAPRQGRDDPRLLGGRARARQQAAAAVLQRDADEQASTSRRVREWRATMLEAVEAGEWAPKTINNARIALLGCCRMAVEDGLMAHNPVLDVRPLPIEFTERPYLRLAQINDYLDACAPHYRPLAAVPDRHRRARLGGDRAPRRATSTSTAGTVRIHKQRVARRVARDRARPRAATSAPWRSAPAWSGVLRDMLAVRAEHGSDDGGWLFLCPPTTRGRYAGRAEPRPPHRKTVHDWHEQALEDAGLADLPLHGLRHTAAAAWLGHRPLARVRARAARAQLGEGHQRLLRAPGGAVPRRRRRRHRGADPRRPPRSAW